MALAKEQEEFENRVKARIPLIMAQNSNLTYEEAKEQATQCEEDNSENPCDYGLGEF